MSKFTIFVQSKEMAAVSPMHLLSKIYFSDIRVKKLSSTISNGSMDNSWTPSTVRFERAVAPKITKASMSAHFHLADHDFGSAKRGRPPGSSRKRNTVKREFKKRDQNREAALRYRLKKRAEQKEKETDLEQLQKRNQFLKNEKYSLTAEVSYLKDLLIEIRKLKGYQ